MRRFLWVTCGVALVLFSLMLLFPVIGGPSHHHSPTRLLSFIKQQGLAVALYKSEHDDRHPPVDRWESASKVYSKGESSPLKWDDRTVVSAAMNGLLDLDQATTDPRSTVCLFPTLGPGEDLWGGPSGVWWIPKKRSTALGFCDGHAKVFKPETFDGLRWRPDGP